MSFARSIGTASLGAALLSSSAAWGVPPAAGDEDDVDVPAAPSPSAPVAPASVPTPGPTPATPPSAAQPAPAPARAPSAPITATPSIAAPAPPAVDDLEALQRRVAALEARAAAAPSNARVRDDEPPAAAPSLLEASPWSRAWPRGVFVGGYVQGQLQHDQLSEDQLAQSGQPLNDDRFLVRRARLRVERGWDYAHALVEVDGNTYRGAAFGVRRAEASLVLRRDDASAPPLAALTLGLFETPFGYEIGESSRARVFLERSLGSRALFPGEPDVGARFTGAYRFLRWSIAVTNGRPVPDDASSKDALAPTASKDVLARVGAEAAPHERVRVSGGVSFASGKGFHAGTPATKDATQWRDLNGNGQVDAGEVVGLPGSAATPSSTFDRHLFGLDAQVRVRSALGWGVLYGEAFAATNYDRGLFVADPVLAGRDQREIGWYAGALQEIGRFAVVGLRVDAYDPNADATRSVAGKFLPVDQTVRTISPLVGLVLPDRARLVFQWDSVRDRLGKDERGVPADLSNDRWALRLQVDL